MNKKVMCVIYHDHDKYKKLAQNAYNSFMQMHKGEDIDVFQITPSNLNQYDASKLKKLSPGLVKWGAAYEINKKNPDKYKKCICLGADTITLSRLDEFLDDDEHQILATLDYPYGLLQDGFFRDKELHCNADVVCFNDFDIIPDILKVSKRFTRLYSSSQDCYNEQAGLNKVMKEKKFTWRIVDNPKSDVYYNVRCKNGHSATEGVLSDFFVRDGKVWHPDGRQIKVWHYCEGFGHRSPTEVKKRVEEIDSMFNEEVINFMEKELLFEG